MIPPEYRHYCPLHQNPSEFAYFVYLTPNEFYFHSIEVEFFSLSSFLSICA